MMYLTCGASVDMNSPQQLLLTLQKCLCGLRLHMEGSRLSAALLLLDVLNYWSFMIMRLISPMLSLFMGKISSNAH